MNKFARQKSVNKPQKPKDTCTIVEVATRRNVIKQEPAKQNKPPFKSSFVSPFSSVLSSGPKKRGNKNEFASYSLSNGENYPISNNPQFLEHPMRSASLDHLKILHNKKDLLARKNYLNERSNFKPIDKYYYPAATSWRYGWFYKNM